MLPLLLLYALVENRHYTLILLLKTTIFGWELEGLDLHTACHFNLAVFYDYKHAINFLI